MPVRIPCVRVLLQEYYYVELDHFTLHKSFSSPPHNERSKYEFKLMKLRVELMERIRGLQRERKIALKISKKRKREKQKNQLGVVLYYFNLPMWSCSACLK